MPNPSKTLSVSQAAALCGVGRTTVGYWIRSKKLRANRVGRNYSIPVQDLLFFLKSTGQEIPSKLQDENLKGPIFKSFQHCWEYWQGRDSLRNCAWRLSDNSRPVLRPKTAVNPDVQKNAICANTMWKSFFRGFISSIRSTRLRR